MKTKIILISLTLFSLMSNVSGQSKADCNNLHLDTTTFYIFPQQDTIVSGNLYYMDTTITIYPVLHLILADTSIITSPDTRVLSSLDSGYVQPFSFRINIKTTIFQNNSIVNGLFHIYDSDWPGDSIVSCYFPIKIIIQSPTDIDKNGMKGETFRIYPNPTDKIATLKFANPKNANCTLTLYDIQGREVETITDIKTDKVEIERKKLLNGLYFFQLRNDKQIIADGKLIIK
jgi:hypothetical protein